MKTQYLMLTAMLLVSALLFSCSSRKNTATPAKKAGNAASVAVTVAKVPLAETAAKAPLSANDSAILDAVTRYVKTSRGLNTKQMTLTLSHCSIDGKQATCQVSYGLKNRRIPPMVYSYTLVKKGDAWNVTGSHPVGSAHATAAKPIPGMPPGHTMTIPSHKSNSLPAGHPAVPKDASQSAAGK